MLASGGQGPVGLWLALAFVTVAVLAVALAADAVSTYNSNCPLRRAVGLAVHPSMEASASPCPGPDNH